MQKDALNNVHITDEQVLMTPGTTEGRFSIEPATRSPDC
ncbi:phospho-2-dehydro-3-deoxyheptonate aldolase [Escherichia coli]|nr:phospho-2-dehydro-3-deoxyheptonate aldolase [Escherichia coli]